MFIIFGFCSFEFLIFELLSFNGYNVQKFSILAEKIFGLFILILKWNKQGCFCPDFISFFEFKMEHSLFYYKYTQNILNLKWNKFNFL